jgi:FkbM family methyltransferase
VAEAGRSAPGRPTELIVEAPRKLYVTRQLHEGGFAGYEAPTAAVMLGLAEQLRPDVVFDIGANVGPHALLLPALLDVHVLAFEPASDVAAVLRHNVELNGLRCTVIEVALGAADEEATLFISPTDTSTSLRSGFRPPVGEVSVSVRRLDSVVAESGLTPTILKIDTETTEPDVLRGAPLLLGSRPWVVCEILPGWTEAAIEDIFHALGYRMFQIVNQGRPRDRDGIAGNATFEEPNWLFAPEAPSEDLWQSIERWGRAIERAGPPRDLAPRTRRTGG